MIMASEYFKKEFHVKLFAMKDSVSKKVALMFIHILVGGINIENR